jgi:hypothetical protein
VTPKIIRQDNKDDSSNFTGIELFFINCLSCADRNLFSHFFEGNYRKIFPNERDKMIPQKGGG